MKKENSGRILIVDDDRDLGESFRDILSAKGYDVTYEEEADCALDMIEDEDFDAVLTDFEMPLVDGMELLERARKFKPRLPIVMMTGFNSTDRAINATKLGAFDYLTKPVEVPEVLDVLAKAVASGRLSTRSVSLGMEIEDESKDTIIGSSKVMLNIFKEIGRVAAKPVSILIEGETGTGKELIARAIFHNSERTEKPFVAVNCAAIPDSQIESELFGHERGAFANTVSQRIGRFEQADGGTLLLDEIGDLPLETQAKLLRVLQEKTITRIGGKKDIAVNVRIITTSRQHLADMVEQGLFREDLFYRINPITICLPPLRERRADIPELVDYFLKRAAIEFGMEALTIHKNGLRLLEGEVWQGNVRQLENVIHKAMLESGGRAISEEVIRECIRSGSPIDSPTSKPAQAVGLSGGFSDHVYARLLAASKDELDGRGAFETLVEDLESNLYQHAVTLSHGNQSKIAKWLGVSRLTVREKLDRFDLFPKRAVSKKKPDKA